MGVGGLGVNVEVKVGVNVNVEVKVGVNATVSVLVMVGTTFGISCKGIIVTCPTFNPAACGILTLTHT